MSGVELDFVRAWCPRHGEPLRETWPAHVGVAMLLLFDAFVLDDRVQRMAGRDDATGALADSERLNALVMECQPLCCFVGDEVSAEVTSQAISGAGPRVDAIRERPL